MRSLVILFHVLCIIVWLGADLVVFSLSLSLLKRKLPIAIRVERAHIAELVDKWVLRSFLATMPVGLYLLYSRGIQPFDSPWMSMKLALFGIIILMAITMLTGAAGTTQTLRKIETGGGDVERLEASLRSRVIWLAYPVLVVYTCILAILYLMIERHA
jgi:Predicted integral membrane protein (DUF2269)